MVTKFIEIRIKINIKILLLLCQRLTLKYKRISNKKLLETLRSYILNQYFNHKILIILESNYRLINKNLKSIHKLTFLA